MLCTVAMYTGAHVFRVPTTTPPNLHDNRIIVDNHDDEGSETFVAQRQLTRFSLGNYPDAKWGNLLYPTLTLPGRHDTGSMTARSQIDLATRNSRYPKTNYN